MFSLTCSLAGDFRFRSTNFICSYLLRKIPVVPSGGYSFVDVRDAAQGMHWISSSPQRTANFIPIFLAFANAMLLGKPGEGYLLATLSLPTSDFFAIMEKVSGVAAPKIKYSD